MTLRDIELEILSLWNTALNHRDKMEAIYRIGELLLDVKEKVPQGRWEGYLEDFGRRNRLGKVRTLQDWI
jgi:hypothetical protein